jgi:hypothetical protein
VKWVLDFTGQAGGELFENQPTQQFFQNVPNLSSEILEETSEADFTGTISTSKGVMSYVA